MKIAYSFGSLRGGNDFKIKLYRQAKKKSLVRVKFTFLQQTRIDLDLMTSMMHNTN